MFENQEQTEISKFYESLPKPTLIAIQELLEDQIYMREKIKSEDIKLDEGLSEIADDVSDEGLEDIKEDDIKNHKIAYLEGYLWDNENAKKAMKKMVDICKADDQKIAFTLSDLFCVDRHRDSFQELINNDVDILFANEDEIKSMAQTSSFEEGLEYAKSLNITAAITKGSSGSVVVSNGSVTEITAQKVDKVVDTTGAGDLFAAGFLYGYSKNKSMEECGNYASIAAAEIISHYGGRPLVKLSSLI